MNAQSLLDSVTPAPSSPLMSAKWLNSAVGTGHRRRVVPSVGEKLGTDYRANLFMTDVRIFETEGKIPRVGAIEVFVDVIPDIDPP